MPKVDKNDIVTGGLILGGLLVFSKIASAFGTWSSGGVKPEDQKYLKDKYAQFKDLVNSELKIDRSKLQFDRPIYKKIAQQQYDAMNTFNDDETMLFNSLKGLNTDDLKVVFMDFGLRARTILGSTFLVAERKDLTDWYLEKLGGTDLQKMITIWKPTGLMK